MKKRILQVSCGVFVLTAGFVGMGFLHTPQPFSPASAEADVSTVTQSEPLRSIFTTTLSDELNNLILEQSHLEVAVSVVDLGTGDQYNAGETDVIFQGASTTKLITAASYLHEVDEGRATLSQRIGGVTARQLLKQMIEDSDNEAWASLMSYLGDKEQDFADTVGLNSYTQKPSHTITSSDMAKMLTLLYQDKLISTTNKELLLGYMKDAEYTELIKSALPTEATVYHKYGTLYGNLHDTAIVSYKGHDFALVIFTKNPNNTTDDYSDRVALIHQLTQTVLNNLTT